MLLINHLYEDIKAAIEELEKAENKLQTAKDNLNALNTEATKLRKEANGATTCTNEAKADFDQATKDAEPYISAYEQELNKANKAQADYQKAYEESKKLEVKKSPNTADPSNIGFYAFIALGTLAFAGSISYKIKWTE